MREQQKIRKTRLTINRVYAALWVHDGERVVFGVFGRVRSSFSGNSIQRSVQYNSIQYNKWSATRVAELLLCSDRRADFACFGQRTCAAGDRKSTQAHDRR